MTSKVGREIIDRLKEFHERLCRNEPIEAIEVGDDPVRGFYRKRVVLDPANGMKPIGEVVREQR